MRPFFVARTISGTVPRVVSRPYKTGEAIIIGSPVVLDANGELTLCGADPAEVTGIALNKAGSTPGWDAANSPTVVTNRKQELSCADADGNTIYGGESAAGTTPTKAHVDLQCGIAKDANGVWGVDLTDTVNKVVEIVDVDIARGLFFFKILESVRTFGG